MNNFATTKVLDTNQLSDCIEFEKKYFSIVTKFYHYCFFGNGETILIPLVWIIIFAICFIAEMSLFHTKDPVGIIYYISLFIELMVNVSFGYYFCKHHCLSQMLLLFQEKYKLDIHRVVRCFQLTTIIFGIGLASIIILVAATFGLYYEPSDDYDMSLASFFDCTSTFLIIFLVIGASFYLCIIWCLQIWAVSSCIDMHFGSLIILHHSPPQDTSMQCVQSPLLPTDTAITTTTPQLDDTTTNTVDTTKGDNQQITDMADETALMFPQQTIEKAVITFLDDMKQVSNFWFINHVIRTLTGLVIITYISVDFYATINYPSYYLSSLIYAIVSLVYFGIIWITAFSAGITNDRFYRFILRRLSSLYADHGKINDVLDKRINHCINKVLALRGGDGLHFAGVTMTMEKALTVGSVIASIILFCIKMYASDYA